jgi:hypothetical protein
MDLDNLQTFHSLFSNWRFHIPDYQRGYAWGPDQWQDLMDDLSTLTEDNDHFTGLLVLHENKDPNLRARARGIVKDVHDIVDGQQRMTTVLILLNEIRNEMSTIGTEDLQEICDGIQQTYLHEPGPGNLLVYKLILDRNNHSFFIRNILGAEGQDIIGPQMQSHHNLLGARNFFQVELRKKHEQLQEDYPAWLEEFYGKIANQMKVMVYHLRSEADAGVVFETMNSRGRKPNELDLVKNYLLFLASKLEEENRRKLSSDINDAWTVIFQQLSAAGRPDDEDTLLEMHWVTTYDYDRKHWAARREKSDHIKNRFKPMIVQPEMHMEMAAGVADYIQTLKSTAVAYRDILQPEHSEAFQIFSAQPDLRKQVVRFSEKLVRLGILRPFIPLLIAIRMKYPEDVIKYLETVQLCEKYAFRVFRVANAHTNSAEAVLFRLANQVYNGKMTIEFAFEELRRNLLGRCSDAVLAKSFDIQELNPWYGKRGLAYFLYEYEGELFKPEEPIINWQTIYEGGAKSIEHILPQNPTQGGYWTDRFSEDDRQRLTDQIGNLTLILAGWNSSLGNKPFPDKKGAQGQPEPCYANSDLKITSRLVTAKDWTPEEIQKRQQRLAEWALKRWHVEPPPPLPDNLFEALKARATQNGLGTEFEQIDSLAKKLKLHPRAYENGMTYRSRYDYTRSVLRLYYYPSGLDIKINLPNFSRSSGIPEAHIREILGREGYAWIPLNQIPDFIQSLEQLAKEVEEQS